MSGDAALGAVSSSSTPSSSSDPAAHATPETAKTVPPPVVEEVPPPAEAEQPAESPPEPQPTEAPEAPSTSKTSESSAPADYEAIPQPQAPPVAPLTYESEEIIISATDAPAVITTTSSPPTMTSALASSISAQAPVPSTAQTTSAAATAAAPLPAVATAPIIAPLTAPLALHAVRSSGPGGAPPGSNPKHPKLLSKAVPSEKPVEVAAADDSASAMKPLTLLELPVDILRLIVKEITHTNDLTALALANSTLYNLAVPHIYSRFDIVWPDPTAPPSEGKSVDALTYGLSTLCLGSTFARTAHRLRNDLRSRKAAGRRHGASRSNSGSIGNANTLREHTKFGSPDYAKYTRKFSLGNGPPDWVAEYMVNKEAGKMLGTLVALCVAKMQNLENFVWDMPTGVVSDVFMALASLPDFDPQNQKCKLDRIWIRWHNNSQSPPASPSSSPGLPPAAPEQLFVPQGSNLTPIGIMLPPHSGHPAPRPAIPYSSSQVEFPTFSVVPPLRSLTVLDIDEVAYLDELAVLIERSCSRLNELRIGIASHAIRKDFVQTWDGANLQQVDLDASWPGESTIGDRRLGGVLGILVGRTYDIRKKSAQKAQPAAGGAAAATQADIQVNGTAAGGDDAETTPVAPTSAGNVFAADVQEASADNTAETQEPAPAVEEVVTNGTRESIDDDEEEDDDSEYRLDKKLKLATLELERVPLSMQVLVRAIDWTSVTTLTILSCPQHESLWRQLKKHFKPTAVSSHSFGFARATLTTAATSTAPSRHYHMALKSIHTDMVSKALMSFIRETLAPNTLEVLFLQDRRLTSASPAVAVEDIFKSAIKPHRGSLTKLLIDGLLRTDTDLQHPHLEGPHRRRRVWTLTTEILNYLTSGRMASLRELAFSLHYRDWHMFLQRLPSLPQLRSLHIQHIADHVVENLNMYDLAMQVADIVTLRPEIQLCFVGICDKCYEVVESRGNDTASGDMDGFGDAGGGVAGGGVDTSVDGSINGGTDTTASTTDEEDDEEEEEDDDDDSDDDAVGGNVPVNGLPHTANGGHDSDGDGDSDSGGDSDDDGSSLLLDGEPAAARPPRLRMREIFFYDDKVAIFKARHGRL